jgi:ankyrin repeat protein
MRYLLSELRLDPNTRLNNRMDTPLLFAVDGASVQLMSILLEFGADPAVRDDEGSNAMSSALHRSNRL